MKLAFAIALVLCYNVSMACTTTTILSPDGRITTCMVCPNVVSCQ
jgi:hypothetical protein